MAEQKTKPTETSVQDYLADVEPERRRHDAIALVEMMARITGETPVMWGPSIVGYGRYDYVYESGHSGSSFLTGFSPRKANLVIYIMLGFSGAKPLLAKLGKHKTGKSCLYINKLTDVDLKVLEKLVAAGYAEMNRKYRAAK